ncbi:MAG: DUF2156 domain-containing protein [Geobacter sp.]|nr:DUF2156 domain-containing protein [Geobacter sp.]
MTSPLPAYPASRPITLDDKALLDDIFEREQPRISEFTFAGLYLFREAHGYRLSAIGDTLVILGRGYDNSTYFLPPLGGNVPSALQRLFADRLSLYGADEDFVAKYLAGSGTVVNEDRDNFDYLHRREDLANLAGRRYHGKKNRINYFTRRQEYTVEFYGPKHCESALRLLDEWTRVRGEVESRSLVPETAAAAEALRTADVLGLEGVVILVGGKVKAFALGERLNRTTSVCHFEKADPFSEGAYQLVDREFSRLLFTDCTYVNREQDLGEPGLRESKLSYHPVELVRKFRAIPRGAA